MTPLGRLCQVPLWPIDLPPINCWSIFADTMRYGTGEGGQLAVMTEASILIKPGVHGCRLPFLPLDVQPRSGPEASFIQSSHKDDIQ
jgi:hypothetical protein